MEKHLFKGKYQMSGLCTEIEIEAINRESAISYIEVAYPTFKWYHSELIK